MNKVWSRANEDGIEMKFFPLTGDHAGSPLRKPGKLTENSAVTLDPSSAHLFGFPAKNLRFGHRRLLFPTKRTRVPAKALLLWEKGRTAEEVMLFRQEKRAK